MLRNCKPSPMPKFQPKVIPQSSNRVSTSLGNSGLCWTVFAQNRDTVVPAEGNGDLQTLICVLVARPRRCLTLSNPVTWQNWMAAYLGYTLWMRTLFRGWPIMVNDTHTRRRRSSYSCKYFCGRFFLHFDAASIYTVDITTWLLLPAALIAQYNWSLCCFQAVENH